ncbi:hypothetical protein Fmac_020467 [Flemingia macrophylla]|uniref:Uncharacterized protein n=1 Tax=Flemingia macrophylla TaxID=520843 RepID=A0ABD1LU63_9FABA
MCSFPSSEERRVASFHSDSSDPVPERSSSKSFRETSLSDKSSSSSLVNHDNIDSSEEEIKSRSVLLSAVTRYQQIKHKIARKNRSKFMWTSSCSGDRKPNFGEAAKVLSPVSVSGEASSCLSSSSSWISGDRSLRYANRCRGATASVTVDERETAAPWRRASCSPHLRRLGEAILKFLSCGGSSEVADGGRREKIRIGRAS